jgi:hypothetical protein
MPLIPTVALLAASLIFLWGIFAPYGSPRQRDD